MAVPLQRKCTCLNELVIELEKFDKRFDSEYRKSNDKYNDECKFCR
jgi:hypothetical protein